MLREFIGEPIKQSAKLIGEPIKGRVKRALRTSHSTGSAIALGVRRETELAAREEDYALAGRLKSESESLKQQLPPVRQYLWGRLQALEHGQRAEQLAAISSLGAGFDARSVGVNAALESPPSYMVARHPDTNCEHQGAPHSAVVRPRG